VSTVACQARLAIVLALTVVACSGGAAPVPVPAIPSTTPRAEATGVPRHDGSGGAAPIPTAPRAPVAGERRCPAEPGPHEAEARRLDRLAFDEQYVPPEPGWVVKKLVRARALCDGAGCSCTLQARLAIHHGLALVLFLGKGPEAKAAFMEAIALDPTVSPDRVFRNADVELLWREAGGR
jgi:hypothetical protein